jgi:phage shock protein E
MSRRSSKKQKHKSQPKLLLIAGVVALIVVVFGGVWLIISATGGSKAEISVVEAATRRDQGAFMLDVRTQEEWEEYHIPDSTLIPLEELNGRLDEVPRDREVVVVCRSGNRSRTGRDTLVSAGFTQAFSMAGGLTAWRNQGYPTVSGP